MGLVEKQATNLLLWATTVSLLVGFAVGATQSCGGEREEVQRLAPKYGAETEVRQWDETRIDMLTPTHAIEVDWSYKWAEAIGQSLYYSAVSGRKPGIVLLVKNSREEQRYVFRCQTVCAKYGISLWIEKVESE